MMTSEEVTAFLERMGWSDSRMERETGITRKTLSKYRQEGAPLWFGLVCAALDAGLGPWRDRPDAGPEFEIGAFSTDLETGYCLMKRMASGDPSLVVRNRRYRITAARLDEGSCRMRVDVEPDG